MNTYERLNPTPPNHMVLFKTFQHCQCIVLRPMAI